MTDNPFAPALSRQSFVETTATLEALRRLDDGLGTREPFLLMTGGPGTGKSTLASEAIARWGSRVAVSYLPMRVTTGTELLEEILRRFGIESPGGDRRLELVARLEGALAEIGGRGQVAVIVVDDAHHLSPELLEDLRLLANAAQLARCPLEILLAGLPTLEATLDDPKLAALCQRISVRAKLEPLSPGETRRYVRHRVNATGGDGSVMFPRKTCAEIAALSGGVPRRINTLAAEAWRRVRESRLSTVEARHVRDAAAALSGSLPTGESPETDECSGPAPVPVPAPPPAASAPSTVQPSPPQRVPQPSGRVTGPVSRPAPAVAATVPAAQEKDDAPGPAEEKTEPAEAASAAPRVPPAAVHPREWVARFLGDKGPIQISSQAAPESIWAREPEVRDPISSEPGETRELGEAGEPGELSRPIPPLQTRGRLRWRELRAGDLRLITTASLVAVGAITAVAIGLHAIGSARQHGARTFSVAATADSTVPVAPSARAPEASAPIPRGPYTLDVGGSLDVQAALDQRQRLQSLTGLEAWVVSPTAPGDGKYRIVLGVFHSYARATGAAHSMMKSRTLANVKVVTLPPRSVRQ